MIIEEYINLDKINTDIQNTDTNMQNVQTEGNPNYEILSLMANRKLA